MKPRLDYQPALDGVRAVAVAMVLLFHGGVGWMGGGYIGVSVFFTLSGYLITSLLLAESDATGSTSASARSSPVAPAACCRPASSASSVSPSARGTGCSTAWPISNATCSAPRSRCRTGCCSRRASSYTEVLATVGWAAVAARALLVAGDRGAVLLDVAAGVRLAGDAASRSPARARSRG